MTFSRRTAWRREENALARAVAAARAQGRKLLDLTESNPTKVDAFDAAPFVAALGHARGARYEPEAFGYPAAREAVAKYYRDRHAPVDPRQVVLTASTSEAYGWLFKLLCEPGDEVIVLCPTYPLLSFLADLEGVKLVPVTLSEQRGFRLRIGELEASLSPRTRAVVVVSPNNPTGTFLDEEDRAFLAGVVAERKIALIVDEVFADYAFEDARVKTPPTFAAEPRALTFVLSGLSKAVGLPQLKLGWIVVAGPAALRAEALARLELVADTYLSVGTPVQRALPELLAGREAVASALRRRTRGNLAKLDALVAGAPGVTRLHADAGWYAVLAAPHAPDEDDVAIALARDHGVLVHPGYFFDFRTPGRYVVSLLPEAATFEAGARTLLAALALPKA